MRETSKHCPECGAEVGEEANFCPNCGNTLRRQAHRRWIRRSRTLPAYGGCAVAAALGAVAAVAASALVVFLFLGGSEPATEDPDGRTDQSEQPAPGTEPLPQEGSLDSIIPQRVGDFELRAKTNDPAAIAAGANDARVMLYESPDGVRIIHGLASFPTSDEASREVRGGSQELVSQGYRVVEEFTVDLASGEQVGEGVELEGERDEVLAWTNGNSVATVVGPSGGYARAFYSNLPYAPSTHASGTVSVRFPQVGPSESASPPLAASGTSIAPRRVRPA